MVIGASCIGAVARTATGASRLLAYSFKALGFHAGIMPAALGALPMGKYGRVATQGARKVRGFSRTKDSPCHLQVCQFVTTKGQESNLVHPHAKTLKLGDVIMRFHDITAYVCNCWGAIAVAE